MLKGKDILFLTASEWQDNAVSTMQIAALLSLQNNVVFVETIGRRLPRWSEWRRVLARLQRMLFGVRREQGAGLDAQRVKIYSPFAIPLHHIPWVAWVNRWLLVRQLRRLCRRTEMPSPLVWCFSPTWESVMRRLPHQCWIFHCVDGLHTYNASPAFLAAYQRMARLADLIFTPGSLLYRELSALNRRTHQIGHGCGAVHLRQYDAQAPLPEPVDVAHLPRPRVIFAGALTQWVDYQLFLAVAQRLPHMSFLLLSYVHGLAPSEAVRDLLSLPNIHLLGYKNYADLPRYYAAADAGIIMYRAADEHTRYCTPTKIYDYCGAGLPCVSTRFPATEDAQAVVRVADSIDDFVAGLLDVIATNTGTQQTARRAYALSNTWERQVDRMSVVIMQQLRDAAA